MPQRQCPDCKTELGRIKLLDNAGDQGWREGLAYTRSDAKRSFWGRYPDLGTIHAWLCPDCGRTLLYAERDSDKLPVPSSPVAQQPEALPIPAETQSKRVQPFTEWLHAQHHPTDPVGALARYALEDPDWPATSDRIGVYRTHLDQRQAPAPLRRAFDEAWTEYKEYNEHQLRAPVTETP